MMDKYSRHVIIIVAVNKKAISRDSGIDRLGSLSVKPFRNLSLSIRTGDYDSNSDGIQYRIRILIDCKPYNTG